MFVHWLYTQRLPSRAQRLGEFEYLSLLILGDRALIPDLQRQCYDRIRNICHVWYAPSEDFVEELYQQHGKGWDFLRRFVVEVVAYMIFHGKEKDNDIGCNIDDALESTAQFASDMAKELKKRLDESFDDERPCPTHPLHDPQFDQYPTNEGSGEGARRGV